MEILFNSNTFMRRRKYQKLSNYDVSSRKKLPVTRLGEDASSSPQQKRAWRIKLSPKLKLVKFLGPNAGFNALKKLKNGCKSIMLGLVKKVGYEKVGKSRRSGSRAVYSLEAVEDRLVFEIYNALKLSVRQEEAASST